MLSIQKLSFRHNREIFSNLSFDIRKGEFIHLRGPNGAGKTSLLRILAGLVPAVYPGEVRGRIEYEGKEHSHDEGIPGLCLTGPWAASRLFCRTVWEEVSFSPSASEEEASQLLEYFGLDHLKEVHPQRLSGGQQQLVLLIAYLSTHPELILLDECFAQLSTDKKSLLVDLLIRKYKEGNTIVLVEHCLPSSLNSYVRPIDIISGEDEKREIISIAPDVPPSSIKTERHSSLQFRNLRTTLNHPVSLVYKDLNIPRCGIIHIKGPVGSGKTTLFRMILGLLPSQGEILLGGTLLNNYSRKEMVRRIGVVLQSPDSQFFCPTVEQEISYAARRLKCYDSSSFAALFHQFNLEQTLEQNPFSLSHGEKKRCQLASSLALNPDLLILDEPDAGMDRKSLNLLLDLFERFYKGSKTILFTSHSKTFLTLLEQRGIVIDSYDVKGEES